MRSMDELEKVRATAAQCRRPVFFTGAGVSAESGIPTFRDAQTGLWARYDPAQLATPEAFESDPVLVWGFYEHRRATLRGCAPNPAHHAIAGFERAGRQVTVITQNVDGFHQKAGSTQVIPLHGNILENRCHRGCPGVLPASDSPEPEPPPCPHCGERSMRPNVVWFGEMLDDAHLARAAAAVEECDLFFMIGTSGLVYPAAGLAELALRAGKPFVEINPEATPFSASATVSLRAKAAQALPRVLEG